MFFRWGYQMKVSIKSFFLFSFLVGFFVVMDVSALSKNKKAAFCMASSIVLGGCSRRIRSALYLVQLQGVGLGFLKNSSAYISVRGKKFELPWSRMTHIKGIKNITGVGAAFFVFKGFEFMFRKKEEVV